MKKITLSFPIVIIISLIIQTFGLLRSLFLSKYFGASATLDSFYLANIFTVSVFSIVSSTITTIAIPELNSEVNEKEKSNNINSYLALITIISITISILLLIILFFTKNVFLPSFNSHVRELFLIIIILLLISQQFRIQSSFSIAFFQNESHYIIPRIMDIIPAVVPVGYLLVSKKPDIIILSLCLAISYIIETLFLNFIQGKINRDYSFGLHIVFNNYLKEMMKRTMPIFLSSAIFQVQIIISNYFAGYFGEGYITLLSNTNQVIGIFQSLFILNLINMIYPKLVREIKKNLEVGIKKMVNYINITNFLVVLLVWGYIAIGHDLVTLMFVRGKFTVENANIVYNFSVILGIVLPFTVIRDYHYRLYYSLNNTLKPMVNSIQTVIFNVFILIIGSFIVHSYIIVLAPAIGTIWSCFNIMLKSRRDNMKIDIKKLSSGYFISNFIGITMYMFILKFQYHSHNLAINILINMFTGVAYIFIILAGFYIFYKIWSKVKTVK